MCILLKLVDDLIALFCGFIIFHRKFVTLAISNHIDRSNINTRL